MFNIADTIDSRCPNLFFEKIGQILSKARMPKELGVRFYDVFVQSVTEREREKV